MDDQQKSDLINSIIDPDEIVSSYALWARNEGIYVGTRFPQKELYKFLAALLPRGNLMGMIPEDYYNKSESAIRKKLEIWNLAIKSLESHTKIKGLVSFLDGDETKLEKRLSSKSPIEIYTEVHGKYLSKVKKLVAEETKFLSSKSSEIQKQIIGQLKESTSFSNYSNKVFDWLTPENRKDIVTRVVQRERRGCLLDLRKHIQKVVENQIPEEHHSLEDLRYVRRSIEQAMKIETTLSPRHIIFKKILTERFSDDDFDVLNAANNIYGSFAQNLPRISSYSNNSLLMTLVYNSSPKSTDMTRGLINEYSNRVSKKIRDTFSNAEQMATLRGVFGNDLPQDFSDASEDRFWSIMDRLYTEERNTLESYLNNLLIEKEAVGPNGNVAFMNTPKILKQRTKAQVEQVEQYTKEKGIDFNQQKTYIYDPDFENGKGNLNPHNISKQFLTDLVQTFQQKATTKRQKELAEIANEIILQGRTINQKQFLKTLSVPGKQAYDAARELTKNTGSEPTYHFHVIDASNPTTPKITLPIESSGQYLAQRDTLIDEMISSLSHGTKKGAGGVGDNYRIFWERWRPEEYDLKYVQENMGFGRKDLSQMTFELTDDFETLQTAVSASRACIKPKNIRTILNDPASKNLILYGNYPGNQNYPIGYTRSNLFSALDGSSVLAMDTLEIGNKEFQENWDKTRAMGLATVQMALDMGFDYLVGNDARVSYGIRQAFSNNEKKLTIQRLGESRIQLQGYGQFKFQSIGCPPIYQGSAHVLVKNWRTQNE